MAPTDDGASGKREKLFIPMAKAKPSTPPPPSIITQPTTPANKESSTHEESKPTLSELSTGNIEAARRKPSQLLRVVASENGRTLFAIFNFGYIPIHAQITDRDCGRSASKPTDQPRPDEISKLSTEPKVDSDGGVQAWRPAIRKPGPRQDLEAAGADATHRPDRDSGDRGRAVVEERECEALTMGERTFANPKLTPVMEFLVQNFQEKVVWQLFRHPQIIHRPGVRSQIRKLLIERYMKGAIKVADVYWSRKIPDYTLVDKSDLQQAAVYGMIQCIDLYDPAVGTTFMQFGCAKHGGRITGSIKDCLRKLQECSRDVAKTRRIVGPMMDRLRHKLGRTPTTSDFCDEYGEEWRAKIEHPLFLFRVYNQVRAKDNDEVIDHMSQVAGDDELPEDRWDDEDSKHFRKHVMELVPDERQAFVVYAYFWLGWNNEHIANYMNCSTSQALQIKDAAQNRIFAFGDKQKFIELLPKQR